MATFLGKLRLLRSPLTRRLATSVDASYKNSLPAKVSTHPEVEIKRWWGVTLWMVGVCVVTRIYQMMDENHGKRPEFVPYQHLRIRKKAFPWSEGTQKTLFWCPITNAGSEGYLELTDDEELKWGKYMHGHGH